MDIISRKISILTFVVYAIILTDTVIGTFFDVIGKVLNSQLGIALFIAMSAIAFCAGQYTLRDFTKKVKIGLTESSSFSKVYNAAPLIQYGISAIFIIIILQIVLFSDYSMFLLIILNTATGVIACIFLGFRCYKFFSWYKSNKRNFMTLAFAIASVLFITAMMTTVILYIPVLLERPATINADYKVNIDFTTALSATENKINLYGYVMPIILSVVPETIGVALFLRYFIERIGKTRYWIIVTLPGIFLFSGTFIPQLLTPAQSFVYTNEHFTYFRIFGTVGWVAGSFVPAFAYTLVARSIRKINPNNMIINYLLIAAFASIIISPTFNGWLINTSYPPFGIILRGFLIFSSFLFSVGIYSAALSVSQDAKLRQLIRKFAANELKLLDNIGTAQMEDAIQKKVIKLTQEQAYSMSKETGAEPSMNDNDIREYLIQVIEEIKKKDQE